MRKEDYFKLTKAQRRLLTFEFSTKGGANGVKRIMPAACRRLLCSPNPPGQWCWFGKGGQWIRCTLAEDAAINTYLRQKHETLVGQP